MIIASTQHVCCCALCLYILHTYVKAIPCWVDDYQEQDTMVSIYYQEQDTMVSIYTYYCTYYKYIEIV